jgi:hypothetical protein
VLIELQVDDNVFEQRAALELADFSLHRRLDVVHVVSLFSLEDNVAAGESAAVFADLDSGTGLISRFGAIDLYGHHRGNYDGDDDDHKQALSDRAPHPEQVSAFVGLRITVAVAVRGDIRVTAQARVSRTHQGGVLGGRDLLQL